MGIIKTLPDNIINQIAAGEVVERPASIVKELIENAIDAKATKIVVEIETGGKKMIRISDDGHGIMKDDLSKAFERHATSKIYKTDDLWKIKTMGFRGEALASIASVSKVSLKSKKVEDMTAYQIDCIAGKMSNLEEIAINNGTIIEVKDLFFNTPAREKFLKTDETEFANIASQIMEYAIGYPWISFKLINEGKVYLDVSKTDDLNFRISEVLGRDIAKNLINVDFLGLTPKVSGFVGKPEIARKNRQSQYLYINGRAVKDNWISAAVLDAFFSTLPEKKYPVFILFIEIDPAEVDVNVHPRKLEVRFAHKNTVYSIVKSAVKEALQKEHIVPEIIGVPRSYWNTEKIFGGGGQRSAVSGQSFSHSERSDSGGKNLSLDRRDFSPESFRDRNDRSLSQQGIDFTENFLNSENLEKSSISIKILGQVNNSYILASDSEGLLIIDQHAAHERIMYNKLIKQAESSNPGKQNLLIPQVIEFSISQIAVLKENIEFFQSIGFDFEDFGKNSFQLSAVPELLKDINIKDAILLVLDDIVDGKEAKKIQDKQHEIICYTACRSAIKFGQKLDYNEQLVLIEQLEKQDQKSTCPHGRPTMIRMTFEELLKRFGRK